MSRTELDEAVLEHILYVIVLPPKGSGEFSPFQGFSLNTYPAVNAIQHICTLPTAIGELFQTRDEAIRLRSIGIYGYAIALIEMDFLKDFEKGLPLTCFVSDRDTRIEVERHIADSGQRGWLHLTTDERNTSVPKLWHFSRADFFSWSRSMAEAVIAEKGTMAPGTAASAWRTFIDWPEQALNL